MARFTQYPAATSPTDYTDATNFLIETPNGDIKLASLEGLSTFFCSAQCTSLTIASADVLQLNSTPLTIVSAPGAGYAIEVISASVKIDFNTTAYATEAAIYIQTSGANSPQAKCSFLDATLTRSSRFENSFVSSSTDTQLISNADLEVTCPNSPTAGDSDIEILVLYRIIAI
jgi:hypothetical protein